MEGTDSFQSYMQEAANKYEQADKAREEKIQQARTILKAAKQAIYALHRDDTPELQDAITLAKTLTLEDQQQVGAVRAAFEELIEAVLFQGIIEHNKIFLPEEIGFSFTEETYLSGLADMTGELVRRSLNQASKRDYDTVDNYHNIVDIIYGAFTQFDFRNGELRKKSDSIRYNIQKLDQLRYEISNKK